MTADKDNKNILAKEVESWKGFEYALRNPNTSLFSKMLAECLEREEYAEAFKTRGQHLSAESLFMALIFQQQKNSRVIKPHWAFASPVTDTSKLNSKLPDS